jgi:hypothetical protein
MGTAAPVKVEVAAPVRVAPEALPAREDAAEAALLALEAAELAADAALLPAVEAAERREEA